MGTSLSFSPCISIVGVATAAMCFNAERSHKIFMEVSLMRQFPNLLLLLWVEVGHVFEANQVRDPGGGNPRAKHPRLRDHPHGQLPAIADAFNAHTFAIQPQITPQRRAHAV